MRSCLIRRADTKMTMILKTLLLLQVLLHTVTAVVPTETKYGDLPGVQNIPCTLYTTVAEFLDGSDLVEWVCEVTGVDATNAGGASDIAIVVMEGMDYVLAAKPDLQSGTTTLLAQGASLSNFTLTIESDTVLTFGEVAPSSSQGNRRLSASNGDLKFLVVRVTTADRALTKQAAEISGDVFGTNGSGDTINLKSVVEDCSANEARILPASGTGTACFDNTDAIFDIALSADTNGGVANCEYFNTYRFSVTGDICDYDPQALAPLVAPVVDANRNARTECCICGGTTVNYNHNVVDGVLDLQLTINAVGSTSDEIESAATSALTALFGDPRDQFDNVFLCLPEGSSFRSSVNWVAYASRPGYRSVYNGDRWCANEITQLHEIGHNWGLMHAWENGVEYADHTGAMGSTTGAADDTAQGNRMCFNGAHSWQLGWYTPYNAEINPLTENFATTLVGVDRAPNVLSCERVVVKLTNPVEDYFIIFNHAVGANEGSSEYRNSVTITSMSSANTESHLRATIDAGESTTFTNWGGSGQSVTVLVSSIDVDATTGGAVVEIWSGATQPTAVFEACPDVQPPTSGPTSEPTSGPTSDPTSEPTSGPTSGPTSAPFPEPTSGPTSAPTSGPTSGPTSAPFPEPTSGPTSAPTSGPTSDPTSAPTSMPTSGPTSAPTSGPTSAPNPEPTSGPTSGPTSDPTSGPTSVPTSGPTSDPTSGPTSGPTSVPTSGPTSDPTSGPTSGPTSVPTSGPTSDPTSGPTSTPTSGPTSGPTAAPFPEPTSGPTSGPTSVPTSAPTSGPTSTPTSGPTSGPSSGPTIAEDEPETEANGDPHFKTWKNEHFEFHGQCDIVMISDKDFANGLGIDIHIRTKIVRFWSYIQRAVIRIGNDILEIEGLPDFSASYWINYEHMGELTDLAGFPVSLNDNHDRYTIDLNSLYPGEKIEIKSYKEFVGVKVVGASEASFGKSAGITGDFRTGNTYARDRSTVLNDFTELGNEWQVLPSDGHFFHDISKPQFPEKCMLPEVAQGQHKRRLGESTVSEEQAEAACAGLGDEFSRKGCIYDILATQDLDMVGAY